MRTAFLMALGLAACAPGPTDDDGKTDGTDGVEDTEVDTADTDWVVDTGAWADTDDTDPDWVIDDTAPEETWLLEINLTVDDAWAMWLDAQPLGTGQGWSHTDVFESDVTLNSDGPHVLAVHGWDEFSVISGFMSAVYIDGELEAVTGSGAWHMIAEDPGANWMFPEYDDDHWGVPQKCSDTTPWGSNPPDLLAEGAEWVWHSTNCRQLGEAWFRLEFEVGIVTP